MSKKNSGKTQNKKSSYDKEVESYVASVFGLNSEDGVDCTRSAMDYVMNKYDISSMTTDVENYPFSYSDEWDNYD